jgi:hypothetical protein
LTKITDEIHGGKDRQDQRIVRRNLNHRAAWKIAAGDKNENTAKKTWTYPLLIPSKTYLPVHLSITKLCMKN